MKMENGKIRLNKYLSQAGICSRRMADEHILAGRVEVNGVKADLGTKVTPGKDVVLFDGKIVETSNQEYVYYALNKPKGVISTASDEDGRKTVLDLVPNTPRVFPVGRLDRDSEGLIILTNDGDLAQRLTHPSLEHEKEYKIEVKSEKHVLSPEGDPLGRVEGLKVKSTEYIKKMFEMGLLIDGRMMKADKVYYFSSNTFNFQPLTFNLILHTGYNRQIRKMCAKIGLEISKLVRVRIAKLKLDDLSISPGEFKIISKEDIL